MQKVSRLYDTFQPTTYFLDLTIERKARKFYGTVDMQGSYTGTLPLTLHAKDLEIISAQLDQKPVRTRADKYDQLVFEGTLEAGEHSVHIEFQGTITDAMHGIYPCYFEVDGVKKELIATQFESHHAREVFPCIDEPEAKAIFNVTLNTEKDVTVLGNMPTSNQTLSGDTLTTAFEPSPRMSPYLVAFVVGELQSKSAQTTNGTNVTIYATHAQPASSLNFGLETAVKSIEFFNDYFGIPYPLPKCDHVALPDFSSGAMENWGLITYREICLLADTNTAISTKEYVATVIAHETSHQWFGNLVTMKWWDDLWLNESFATLMEYMAVDAIYPKWNMWMTFATQETLSALRRDYLPGVQAVKTDVNHPDEISTLFDPSIVYAKGARLLKMLHSYIGEDAFRVGLKQYFKDHSYKNTHGADLWEAFSRVTGKDIGGFMQAWLEQPGIPMVTIASSGTEYKLSQKRFVIGDIEEDTSIWPIPLNASIDGFPELLSEAACIVPATDKSTLYINKGNSAHFVTAYDKPLYEQITAAIRDGELAEVDRLALLHETSLLARSGVSSATSLFQLLDAYREEQKEPVWDIISMIIADLKRFIEEDDEAEAHFKSWVTSFALPLHETLGWEEKDDEAETDTKLRTTILGLLSYGEYQPVVDKGLSLFHAAHDITALNGELRAVIFGIAAKFGTDADRELLLDLYKTSQIAEIQQDALSGLTTTRNTDALKNLISLITDETVVRAQDVDRWFIYLIRNRYSRADAWEWMVNHWQWITEKFASDKSYDSFPRYAASALSTYKWKEAYDSFFSPLKDQPALTRAIDLGSKDIAARAEWIERDFQEFRNYLLSLS